MRPLRYASGFPHNGAAAVALNDRVASATDDEGRGNAVLICKDRDNTVRWRPGERLHHYFEQTCDRVSPDHAAVSTGDVTLTFRELDDWANQAARYLLGQGLKPGDRIALFLDKSIHSYVALLAVLKIGAAYVPLDANFPAERIRFILGDAGVKAIVSLSEFQNKLEEFEVVRIYLDRVEREIEGQSTERLDAGAAASSDQLFYVVYTSGTTGRPKGVAINHSGICNFVKVAGEVYGIREGDRCYQGMTLAFDFHVESLWVPLIAGGTLVSGKFGGNLFGNDLHAFLLKEEVTYLPCVPTLWATIEQDLPDVRIVLLSGESVPHHLVVRWHRPDRCLLNAYGPTECSVSSTLRRLVPENRVTIGVPLPTYTVVILDEHKDEAVRPGEIGEIGIAGVALAVGYLNREELTRAKFIPDFLSLPNNPSKRIYRTGDYGRIGDDGELEFHGRIDTQVKIRGYRIELGEIEAVLAEMPGISQAVVNPYEPEPGTVELVAYYTSAEGASEVSATQVREKLRKQLPPYMVPDYLEQLAAIPMTSNNKADRKNLPAPKGPRLAVSGGDYVAPRTKTEKVLAAALAEVMKLERASVEDNFFQDLGAHSLLMAQFGAAIRKRLKISAVSMQDIYQNPTIGKLARHLDSLPDEVPDEASRVSNRQPFHIPSDLAYYGCGALQLIWMTGWAALGLWIFVFTIQWTYAAMPDLGAAYLRLLGLTVGLALLFSVLPIAAKWLLIGKWRQDSIPVWSLRYFRFWAVKSLIRSAPMAAFGDPFFNLYLRLLGAKIGANTVIHAKRMSVCTDLLTVGDNTILSRDSIILGYKAESNYIHIGPIHIGSDAFVGEAAVVDINTVMEDETQLGTVSSLHEGQCIPRGKRYHGTPARETATDYCAIEPKTCSPFRRWSYSLVPLALSFALIPIPLLFGFYWFPDSHEFVGGPQFAHEATAQDLLWLSGQMLLLSFALVFIGGALGLLYMGVASRLMNLLLKRDKTYVLYGFHYFVHQLIVATTNSVFYNRLFGDSSAIVHYMRWVGWNLNKIIQTGTNFGMDQRHENPFLCDIGSGTLVSGGLKMMNETMSSSSFKISQVKVGPHTYLGNKVHFPANAQVGANCLIATKALVPIEGPARENIGLLGSPAFEIPRATDRDVQMAKTDEATRQRQLRAKNRYNLVSATLFLLNNCVLVFLFALIAAVSVLYFPRFGMESMFVFAAFAFLLTAFWLWFAERGILRFGRLVPKIVPVLHEYFWFHERHWKMSGLWRLEPAFAGTPFKNFISRIAGVRIGKKVFDDGGDFDEYTLIEIGDYTNVNAESSIQPHSLEEAVFKSDYVKIGAGCTLGCASYVHYGVTMGDRAVLEANAFLMKGEIAESDSVWGGNPARSIGGGPAARQAMPTA